MNKTRNENDEKNNNNDKQKYKQVMKKIDNEKRIKEYY